MKQLVSLSLVFTLIATMFISVWLAPISLALPGDMSIQSGAESAHSPSQPTEIFGQTGAFTKITNVLLFIIGAISVIMLIIGGLRYVISGGSSSAVTGAKNTILYAIVGIIVALLAYAIVNFVISSFAPGATSGGTNV